MRSTLLFLAFALAVIPSVRAADDVTELEAVLEQQTEAATKVKLNADFVPGMLTILQGDEMEALGAQTVLEALAFVPGVQIFKEINGTPNLVVRGITYPFNTGNTKVLVNSISLSRDIAAVNSTALLMRIEQVERIEFIRGPASGVYGAFAFQGVINIITKQGVSRGFVAAGTDDMKAAGVMHTWTDGPSRLTVNASASDGSDNEGARGLDSQAGQSASVLQFERGSFTFTYEATNRGHDFQLPGAPVRFDSTEHTHAFNIRQRFTHSKRFDSELRVNYLDTGFTTGQLAKVFVGDRLDVQGELHWRPRDGNEVQLRLETARDIIDLGTLAFGQPNPAAPPILSVRVQDAVRRINSASIQDQVDLSRRLTLTAGMRVDDYNDVGTVGTPRVAFVYRANARDLVKAQYAQGFRPPTFFEIFAPGFRDDSLDFEVIGTSELGWIRHGKRATTRATVFYSRVRDVLFPVLPPVRLPTVVNNDERIHSHGLELEWSTELTPRLRSMANLSLVDTFDSRLTSGPNGDSATAADVMGNAALVWTPKRDLSLGGHLRYVGDRHVVGGKTAGYQTFDLTATAQRWPGKEWTTRVGAKNLFNDRVTYLDALPDRTAVSQFEPRTTWVRVARSF